MRQNQIDDELVRSYLMGELPEPEADRLEERLLVEDELFDLMEALEAELLAACSRDELGPAERERVLSRLASSPQGRERLALAKALNMVADGLSKEAPAPVLPFHRRAAPPKAVFQWAALAAAGLLMVAGLSWFSRQTPQAGSSGPLAAHERPAPASPVAPAPQGKPIPPASNAQTLREPQRTPERVAEKQEAPAKRSAPVKAVFALSLMTLRGAEEIEELHLPPGADIAELQIDLEGLEDSESFRAAVRSKDKGTVWEQSGLKSRPLDWTTAALVLDIPAGRLVPGRYEVAVRIGTKPEEMTQEFQIVQESR